MRTDCSSVRKNRIEKRSKSIIIESSKRSRFEASGSDERHVPDTIGLARKR